MIAYSVREVSRFLVVNSICTIKTKFSILANDKVQQLSEKTRIRNQSTENI